MIQAEQTNPAARHAFSLLELVAVMLLLGVLVGLIAPRAVSMRQREAGAEVDRVQRLLTVAAQKDALTTILFALEYDGAHRELRIIRQHAGGRSWVDDPYMDPVRLDRLVLADAEADGITLDDRGWRVIMNAGSPRPTLSLLLAEAATAGDAAWQIDLLPEATESVVRYQGERPGLRDVETRTVDLDDAGRGEEAW